MSVRAAHSAHGSLRISGRKAASLTAYSLAAQICCTLALAANEEPATVPVDRRAPVTQALSTSQEPFTIGDRLKITVFERYAAIADQEEQPALSSLIERTEMTGEYIIQQDGSIFLPLIGAVATAGETGETLEAALSARFTALFDARPAVAIQLLEREPVYVAGVVPQMGTYRYVPGMTVLHALALSGASATAGADRWQQLEFLRERERSRQSMNRLEHLLARASVLASEAGLQPGSQLQRLRELADQETADRLLADASRLRELEREKVQAERGAVRTVIKSLDQELSILHESIADAEANMRDKSDRAAFLQDLRERGDTTDQNVHLARSELNQARATWNELRATQARVERNVTEMRHQMTRLEMEDRLQIEKELQAAREEISQEEATRATVAQLLVNIQSFDVMSEETRDIEMEIIRRTPLGVERLASSLFTDMRPGDVLYIRKGTQDHETAGM